MLYENEIGARGAQYLADALKQNKVTQSIPFFVLFNRALILFLIGISHTVFWRESDQWSRGRIPS